MQAENSRILITLNANKQNQIHLTLDQRIINYNLHPIQTFDYSQPFQIPENVATTQYPFDIVTRFAEAHNYLKTSPKIKLPITTNNYKDVVDPITYEICSRYTCLDYANEVDEILKLAKWLQFKELEQALAAAVAVNYYTGFDERQIQQFIKKNNLYDITPEQIEQIYEEHKDLFNYVEQKTKQQFIKESENTKTE